MDDRTLRQTVFETLRHIAPEVVPEELDPRARLRDQVDLDSMDWLTFLLRLHERLGVDIPEADYGKLASLDDHLAYLRAKAS